MSRFDGSMALDRGRTVDLDQAPVRGGDYL
ncbi:hypothetical protein ABIA41_004463 [Bradyrhizobium sp. USDA 313]